MEETARGAYKFSDILLIYRGYVENIISQSWFLLWDFGTSSGWEISRELKNGPQGRTEVAMFLKVVLIWTLSNQNS